MEHGIKELMVSEKNGQVMRTSWYLELFYIVIELELMLIRGQDWSHCPLPLQYSIESADIDLKLGIFLGTSNLEMKSSAYKAKQRLGLMGKGHPCRNYHACLSKILESLKRFQGNDKVIQDYICIGDHVSFRRLLSQLLLLLVILKVKTNCVEDT